MAVSYVETIKNIEKVFDQINLIYGEIVQEMYDDEDEKAKAVFWVMLNLLYKTVSVVTWDWKNNMMRVKVGSVYIKTFIKQLPDDNSEICTEIDTFFMGFKNA
jgi:hypothetical protein